MAEAKRRGTNDQTEVTPVRLAQTSPTVAEVPLKEPRTVAVVRTYKHCVILGFTYQESQY